MKNLLITLLIIGGGYFAYTQLNSESSNSGTLESETRVEGSLTDINDNINDALQSARDAAQAAGDRTQEAVDELQSPQEDEENNESQEEVIEAEVETEVAAEIALVPGKYVDYKDVSISDIDGKIVLDFYASWCPSCRTLESDIQDSLADIPSDLTIVKVNYDDESDLKKKYGVTRQHTMVQVDAQGNLIQKWSGGSTLESIVDQLN